MKFKILVILNKIEDTINVLDDFEKFKKYVSEKTSLEIEYSFVSSALDLEHKSFGIRKIRNGVKKEMYGLDGVKGMLREAGLIESHKYHAVFFLYGFNEAKFREKFPGGLLGHWTYFKQIVPGTEFVEIATLPKWDKIDDIYRVLTHEFYHVCHNRARRAGVATLDTMDRYDLGNRIRNLNELLSHKDIWKSIVSMPRQLKIIRMLELFITILKIRIKIIIARKKIGETVLKKKAIKKWALAIKEFEGWYIGSRSHRNNNPGNLKFSKFQIGEDEGGFSIFKTYEDGFKALIFQLELAISGKSRYYKPTMTLLEFFEIYAPSSDNNEPKRYAEFVAHRLGCSTNRVIKYL